MRFFLDRVTGKLCRVTDSTRMREYEESPRWRPLSPQDFSRLEQALPRLKHNLLRSEVDFRGRLVHILANGPSMRNFGGGGNDLVVGVNAAGLHAELDYWICVDPILDDRDLNKFLRKYWKSSTSKHVLHVALALDLMAEDPDYVPWACFDRAIGPASLSTGLYWNRSSTHVALDFVRHMAPSKVCLWGVDYENRGHFYTGSTEIPADTKDLPDQKWEDFGNHVEGFEVLGRELRNAKIEVLNMNPRSAIASFPRAAVVPQETQPAPMPMAPCGPGPAPARIEASPYLMTRAFTFFTVDSPYVGYANRCISSFRRHGLEVCPVPMLGRKDWMSNILQRVRLFGSLAEVYPSHSICMLDCDLVCQAPPVDIAEFQGDVGVHHRKGLKENHEYSAGITIFRPTEKGRACLRRWVDLCVKDKDKKVECREQLYLREAILADPDLRVKDLGNRYNCKPERVRDGDGTVIIHDPASRKTLAKLGGKR